MKIFLVFLLVFSVQTIQAKDFIVLATQLCEYTQADDRNGIRKALKKAGVKIRRIYDDIQCNNMSLYAFAKTNNAQEVMAFYEKKVKGVKNG